MGCRLYHLARARTWPKFHIPQRFIGRGPDSVAGLVDILGPDVDDRSTDGRLHCLWGIRSEEGAGRKSHASSGLRSIRLLDGHETRRGGYQAQLPGWDRPKHLPTQHRSPMLRRPTETAARRSPEFHVLDLRRSHEHNQYRNFLRSTLVRLYFR